MALEITDLKYVVYFKVAIMVWGLTETLWMSNVDDLTLILILILFGRCLHDDTRSIKMHLRRSIGKADIRHRSAGRVLG